MKVWELSVSWDDGPFHNKLFREETPPSINRIGEVLSEWLSEREVLKVTESFLRGSSDHDFNWYRVELKLVDVE